MNFVPTATLGIMAREYEQQQFIGLLQTLGPQTPVLPLILKGILGNSSLSNKNELIAALDKMGQPNPQAQEMEQMQQQLAIQAAQAQIAVNTTQAKRNEAEAMNTMVEAQLKPQEIQAKIVASSTNNLPDNDEMASREFDRRVKIADLMLKEKDIENKLKVVEMQTASKSAQKQTDSDFLKKIIGE
jgi:xanthine dehydrogenase iron-sulfur cluster and FAD-binding subunit A